MRRDVLLYGCSSTILGSVILFFVLLSSATTGGGIVETGANITRGTQLFFVVATIIPIAIGFMIARQKRNQDRNPFSIAVTSGISSAVFVIGMVVLFGCSTSAVGFGQIFTNFGLFFAYLPVSVLISAGSGFFTKLRMPKKNVG